METIQTVKEYYGKVLSSNKDLKTNACCTSEGIPEHYKKILSLIDDEIKLKFYGCGSPIPGELNGKTVLDLGCGTGRDAYILSYLVGETGKVIGLDMTDEQLAVARKHIDTHMKKFGFQKPNVEFMQGYIEDLSKIPDKSVDVIISNCVINLSPDKQRVFSEIFRVLKESGELHFSDVFASRRVPENIRSDPVLYGECLGGALYIEDFRRMLLHLGIKDYRVISNRKLTINNPGLQKTIGNIEFYSTTVRAFNLPMEDICEDYGQVATYLGSLPESPDNYIFDDHHQFEKGKPALVCGNTADMLGKTRFARHFEIKGDKSIHFWPFDCSNDKTIETGGCC